MGAAQKPAKNHPICAQMKADNLDGTITVIGIGDNPHGCAKSEDQGSVVFPIAAINLEKQTVAFGIAVFASGLSRGAEAVSYTYDGKTVLSKRTHIIAPELTTKDDPQNELAVFDMSAAAFAHFAEEPFQAKVHGKRLTFQIIIPSTTFKDVLAVTTQLVTASSAASFSSEAADDLFTGGTSGGTGFIVSKDGHILTAAHLVENKKRIDVIDSSGQPRPAKLVKISKSDDVALLKIDMSTPHYLSIVDSRNIELGTKVYTLGFPAPQLLGTTLKYSNGAITAVAHDASSKPLFQISVPLQPGNSGGPLITESGSVIGIVVGEMSTSSFLETTGALPQNINFALKSAQAIPLLPSGVAVEKRHQTINETQKAIVRIEATGGTTASH